MKKETMVWTSFFATIFTVLALRFLNVFQFIQWSPVGWADRWALFGSTSWIWKWLLFSAMLMVMYLLLYILVSRIRLISPGVLSLMISIIVVISIEWTITSPVSITEAIQTISYPFLAVVAIVIRFVVGTAIFMQYTFESKL